MDISKELRKHMEKIEKKVILLNTDAGVYTGVVRCAEEWNRCIYIAVTAPCSAILEHLKRDGVDVSGIKFIDCISGFVGEEKSGEHYYINSPTMLEDIILKFEILRKKDKDVRVVFIDSITALCIHNNERVVSEFLHYTLLHMRKNGFTVFVISLQEQNPPQIDRLLHILSDKTFTITSKGILVG